MTITSIVLTGVSYLIYAFLLRCIIVYGYRVLLHPLHSFPGPFVAKFTDWYGAFYTFLGRLHLATYQDHQVYGKVIRQGPNKLIFDSVAALHDIYQSDRLFKSPVYLVTQPESTVYNLWNTLDKRLHRLKRKVYGHGINDQAMRSFEPTMMRQADVFVEQLAKSCGSTPKAVNMTDRCKYLGIDVVGELGFGTDLQLQTDSKNRFIVRGMQFTSFRNNLYMQYPRLMKAGMELLMTPLLLARAMKYYNLIVDLLKTRRSKGNLARQDLYSFLSDFKDPETGHALRLRDIWSEATFFIPAGSDTTSTTLTAAFFYLSRYPESYKKLVQEIRSTFQNGEDIRNGPTLTGCTYLRACLDETLRMTPPICTTLWRELPAEDKEPFLVDGHIIPPGTHLGVNMYAIHHNEAYFPNSFLYSPERWLSPDTNAEVKAAHKLSYDAFSAFSLGSRGCAGKAMAYQEMSVVLAKTLWYLDFERPSGKEDRVGEGVPGDTKGRGRKLEFQVFDEFVSRHDGPFLVFRPNGEKWKELGRREAIEEAEST